MTTRDACTVPGCPRPVRCRGLCRAHYRQLRTGLAVADMRPIGPRGKPFGAKARRLEKRDAAIRQIRKDGALLREIAERYGLSTERVRQICPRLTEE